MKKVLAVVFISWLVTFAVPAVSGANGYENSAQNAIDWIEGQQNIDGSWGQTESIKPFCTAEVVSALRSFYRYSTSYYWGIAWLENHNFENLDYIARKVLALLPHGDYVQTHVDELLASQRISFANTAGWGLSAFYDMDPIDTALGLTTLSKTTWNDHQAVLDYLEGIQNLDGGWSVSEETSSDILTTAKVVQALCLYQSADPNLYNNVIGPAESFLDTNVTTGSSVLTKTETVLALWPNGQYPAKTVNLLDSVTSSQDPNGHWEGDVYTTANVVRAVSAVLGKDPEATSTPSDILDANLRSGINLSLGNNEADGLTNGEMETLTNLNGQGMGINDLTGISDAVNLEYADLRNNQISDLQPFMDLPNPESITVLLAGNPLSDQEDADGDGWSDLAELNAGTNPLDPSSYPQGAQAVPAVGGLGLMMTAIVLLGLGALMARHRNRFDLKHS